MRTMTIEPESPEQWIDDEPQVTPSCDDLDPDFIIEASGGPIDGGGGPHTGPNPPPG